MNNDALCILADYGRFLIGRAAAKLGTSGTLIGVCFRPTTDEDDHAEPFVFEVTGLLGDNEAEAETVTIRQWRIDIDYTEGLASLLAQAQAPR